MHNSNLSPWYLDITNNKIDLSIFPVVVNGGNLKLRMILCDLFKSSLISYFTGFSLNNISYCPACRTSLIATRFWVVVICPIIKCLALLEFSFILFDLCLFITIFNCFFNYVPIVTFWIFTYHKIWILLIIFCFLWNYWIIYFLTCLEVFWSVVS